MNGVNLGRLIVGGVVAGILVWIIEGAASTLYMGNMQAAIQAHGLSMQMDAGVWLISIFVSLIVGLTLVFFYAAARPRFGPGPRTAVTIAVVLWGAVGLVEMILAALAGGWIYREGR